jgi:hypothetical protein
MARPVFALRVQAEPGVPGEPSVYQRLRGWLKRGLRDFGLRCLDIHEEPETKMETSMPINLNDVEPQRDRTLAPSGIYVLKIRVKPGSNGGWLRAAKNQRTHMLAMEYTIVGGDYSGKTILDWITIELDETDDVDLPVIEADKLDNYRKSVRMGLIKLRAIVDSAFGLDPNDTSDAAKKKRNLEDYDALNGLKFLAQVEQRPASGKYGPSNVVDFVITPDLPDWKPDHLTKSSATGVAVVAKNKKTLADELDDEIPNF